MSKTIVITRARGDEAELAEALRDRGHHIVHEPMTEIVLDHTVRAELEQTLSDDPDAVIVTSRHGVAALASLSAWRDMALLCVGQATADAALAVGFIRASSAGGDVERMIAYIADAYDASSRFLYVSAMHVREDIEQRLAGYAMQVQRIVAYEAQAAASLSETLAEQLRRGHIDAVTFMSERSARIFADLLAAAGLTESAEGLHACALSETVAGPLQSLPWRGIHTAREATLASLIDCVDNALHVG